MVNVLVLTNTQKFEPSITAFLESISLKTPEAAPQTAAPAGGDVSAIVGSWGMSSSDQSSFAMSHGTSGYITRQYGRPRDSVHAVQLEMALSTYMDETRAAMPVAPADPARLSRLRPVLRDLLRTSVDWRPDGG